MYAQIKKDIKQDYYQRNYPNDGQRFVAWYLRNIYNLDIHEAKECVTDGADDKQIDAVFVDNSNCIVHIIQGKFYSEESVNAEPLRETVASWLLIQNLEKLQESANEKLKIKINEISNALDDDFEICFELITTSVFTESAQNDLDQFNEKISSDGNLKASLEVIDKYSLAIKYADALQKNRPYIDYDFTLETGKYMELTIGGSNAVIAAIPLRDCVKIPGIKDGSLFRKNVRQFLGNSKKVSKDIADTIKKNPSDFFFLHNGITAICSKMVVSEGILSVKELNVVNGCQSLSTIHSCGEAAKKCTDGYIMFRFYETDDANRAESISTSTNSQSPVKARDLRSNDKFVLKMKKNFEQFYSPNGYFVTKRGETVDKTKYKECFTVYLTDLGKQMIAWNSQRPTMSYSESKIFDKYFDQLFHRDYSAENILSLKEMYDAVYAKWTDEDNPLGFEESLLSMKAYAPYHHLYAMSAIICEVNKMVDLVPDASSALNQMKNKGLLENVIELAGTVLNSAYQTAAEEAKESGKIFVPPNWVKSKQSLKSIKNTIKAQLSAMKAIPSGKEFVKKLYDGLTMNKEFFESRWSAD